MPRNRVPTDCSRATCSARRRERRGFTRFGVAAAVAPPRFDVFDRWLDEGRHAGMRYLSETRETRRSPESLLPGARSVVCLAAPHAAAAMDGAGRIAVRALRAGRRLPRHAPQARARGRRRRARTARGGVDASGLRRLDAHRGARLRGRRGPGLDRQERLPDRRRAGLLSPARRDPHGPRPARRRAGRRALRLVRPVPRRVPDGSVPRAGRARRGAVHRLLDHRAPRAAPRRVEGTDRRSRVRLRRLPGGLSVEPPARGRRGRRRTRRTRRPRARASRDPRDGQGRVAPPLRSHRDESRRPARPPAQRRRIRGRVPRRGGPAELDGACAVADAGVSEAARWALGRLEAPSL